jgi:outer membrane lipoprotein LolB
MQRQAPSAEGPLAGRRALLGSLVVGSCAVLLGACASPGPAADQPRWSGRLALSVAAHDGQPARGVSGSFELWGSADRGGLELAGPLGALLLKADWSPGRVRVDAGQGVQTVGSLDELATIGLGEPLPLSSLFHWLRGQPEPGTPAQSLDGGFEQRGWRLDTAALADGRLTASRSSPPALQLRIRLDPPSPVPALPAPTPR